MWSCRIAEVEEGTQARVGFDLGAMALQVNPLVFDRSALPFYEDVVEAAFLTIHLEPYAELERRLRKYRRDGLSALTNVDRHPGHRTRQSPLHRIRIEGCASMLDRSRARMAPVLHSITTHR